MAIVSLSVGGREAAGVDRIDISEAHRRFAMGNKYYQNKEYKKAEAEYRALIESGVRDPTLFYNAGNTYVQLGQKGKAVVMYERALRLAPRDRQVRKNLDYVRPAHPPPPFILWRPFLFLRDFFSLNEWLWILDGLVVWLAITLSLSFLLREGVLHSIARRAFVAGLVVTVVVAGFVPWRWYEQRVRKIGVIVQENVVSHHGPSDSHGEHLKLAEGVRVEVLGREGNGWLRVRPLDVPRSSRERTYVRDKFVERI